MRKFLALIGFVIFAACGQADLGSPSPIPVADPNGDDDGDGILNAQDLCPGEPGVKEKQGCPWPDCAYTIGKSCSRLNYTFCNDDAGLVQVLWCPISPDAALETSVSEEKYPNHPVGTYALYEHGTTHQYLIAPEGTNSEVISWKLPNGTSAQYQLTQAFTSKTDPKKWFRDFLLLPSKNDITGLVITTESTRPIWIISTDYDKTKLPTGNPDPPLSVFIPENGYTYVSCASPCQF